VNLRDIKLPEEPSTNQLVESDIETPEPRRPSTPIARNGVPIKQDLLVNVFQIGERKQHLTNKILHIQCTTKEVYSEVCGKINQIMNVKNNDVVDLDQWRIKYSEFAIKTMGYMSISTDCTKQAQSHERYRTVVLEKMYNNRPDHLQPIWEKLGGDDVLSIVIQPSLDGTGSKIDDIFNKLGGQLNGNKQTRQIPDAHSREGIR